MLHFELWMHGVKTNKLEGKNNVSKGNEPAQPTFNETTPQEKSEPTENATNKNTKQEVKESSVQPLKQTQSPKKVARPKPNIPEPEAAIDSLECQHRLLEHIQKEQNTILSRMQTIDAQIMGKFCFIYTISIC